MYYNYYSIIIIKICICYVARRKNIIAITTKDYSKHMHRTLAVNLTLTILITFHALCMHEHGMGTQKLILKERTVSQSATLVVPTQ